jgi:hypothetical protein
MKRPPGYQLHDNLCFPEPIDKNSPEAAMSQGIGGSRGDLPASALETSNNPPYDHPECPPTEHWDFSREQCMPNESHGSGGTDGTGF